MARRHRANGSGRRRVSPPSIVVAGAAPLAVIAVVAAVAGAAIVVAAAVAGIGAGVGVAPVGAATDDSFDCGARVVDLPGVLDVDVVAEAAATATAGEVHVLAFGDLPDGDLGATVEDYLVACHTDAAAVAPDVIVLSFSTVDRQSDVFFGSELPGGQILADVRVEMTGPFPEGRFTDGVLDAIALVESRLGGGLADDEGGSGGHDDGGGLAPAVPIGAAVVAAGGTGAAYAVYRRRRLVTDRNRLAEAVVRPRARVGALREQTLRFGRQAELWAHLASGRTAAALDDKRRRARDAHAATEGAAALLGQAIPGGIENASAEELGLASRRLEQLNESLDHDEHALAELLALGARLDHLRVALPAKRELLQHELSDADALASSRRSGGWAVDAPAEELARIRRHLDGADVSGLPLDLLTLSEGLEGAEALLFAAVHDLQSLPDRAGSVVTWRERQAEAVELEQRRAAEVRTTMNTVAGVHDPASWAWAAEHPARAEQHLTRSADLAAVSVARSDDQDFDGAGAVLEEAGLELIAADELLDQVEDLVVDLDQARTAAPRIVAESRAVSERVTAYVEAHRDDLDASFDRPEQVAAAIDGLESVLAQRRPNFLLVAQTADRLNRELDDVLAGARQQHERMEALRRQADREVARASRAIVRARSSIGWELFESRESAALDRLDHALRALPGEPTVRIEGARDLADEAVSIQERIIARRRRGSTWVVGTGGGAWGGGSGG
ncbi:MAG: hypothetical protein ACFCVK_22850, partial [Acidimicrobiales bacterium]